ncbi:MAG: hypothetical protein U1E54_00955 [Candidatus Levybacteria bacterium]|nr:hypothetical protein [Candidatus Levybacteria bacterium]
MKEQQPIEWESIGQRFSDLDIQAKGEDRRLVDKKGVVTHEYKFVKEFVKKAI